LAASRSTPTKPKTGARRGKAEKPAVIPASIVGA
jgi:hypothetical protein